MLSKKVKSRFFLFFIITISLGLLIVFIFKSLEKNIVYFLSPTEIYKGTDISLDKKIRIGGLVKVNSITKDGNTINFVITDLKNEIVVSYTGIIPNLFSEGKGVVAEGKLKDKKYFIADTILAKHDENYMPPEVKKALEKTDY
tara:strand:+ start:1514 stop:1942 length:429 start_codon:yes stop_codon:yes gene_type:complete